MATWYPRRRRPGGFDPLYQAYEPALEVRLRMDPMTPRGWGRYAWGALGTGVAGLVTYFQPHKRMQKTGGTSAAAVASSILAVANDGMDSFPMTWTTPAPNAFDAFVAQTGPMAKMSMVAGAHALQRGNQYGTSAVNRAVELAKEIDPPRFDPWYFGRVILGQSSADDYEPPEQDSLFDATYGPVRNPKPWSRETQPKSSWVRPFRGDTPGLVGATRTLGGKDIFDVPQWQPTIREAQKTPWARTRSGPTRTLGGKDIFDSDAPLDGADPVAIEIQDLDPAPGEAPRPTRGTEMRGHRSGHWPHPRLSVSEEQMAWYRQADTATAAPQSTPTVRAQARRGTGAYTYPDEIGYRPMAGTQGVVADLAQGLNWTAAPPRDVFATIADEERPCEKSRFDWNRESVRFPLETARYARENDNVGVRNFRYGDPPGPPGPSALGEVGCIGAAALAATLVTGSVVPVMG